MGLRRAESWSPLAANSVCRFATSVLARKSTISFHSIPRPSLTPYFSKVMDPFMAEALAEAAKGAGETSPNPAVGAIVVRDGKIVGRGHHLWERVNHAEIEALQQAGEQSRGAT